MPETWLAAPEPADIAFDLPAFAGRSRPEHAQRLVILADGQCLLTPDGVRFQRLQVTFAWRGSRQIRLLARPDTQVVGRWRWRHTELDPVQWARLNRWLLWLERGPRLASSS